MENSPSADLEVCFYDGEWNVCVETCEFHGGWKKALELICNASINTCRGKDPQNIRAGASGGEEWEVVHREGWGGAERLEPREQDVRGAVWRGSQHVSLPGGRHHSRGAAQHQEHPFLPHNYRKVRRTGSYSYVLGFIVVPCLMWLMLTLCIPPLLGNPSTQTPCAHRHCPPTPCLLMQLHLLNLHKSLLQWVSHSCTL